MVKFSFDRSSSRKNKPQDPRSIDIELKRVSDITINSRRWGTRFKSSDGLVCDIPFLQLPQKTPDTTKLFEKLRISTKKMVLSNNQP